MSAPTLRNSSANVGPECGISSSIVFRIRHATGLRSLANASHPSRNASKGIDPPPANGSTTKGISSPCAALTKERLTPRWVEFAALFQFAKSAINSRIICRTPSSDSMIWSHFPGWYAMFSRILRASSLNVFGQ